MGRARAARGDAHWVTLTSEGGWAGEQLGYHCKWMKSSHSASRAIAFLCLAVLLIVALIPTASGLPFFILIPLWLFFAAIVTLSIRPPVEHCAAQQVPFLSILPSRAPPIPFSL